MAIARPGPGIEAITGDLDGVRFSLTRGSSRVTLASRQTKGLGTGSSLESRERLRSAAKAWRQLTDADREAWRAAGETIIRDPFGPVLAPLSGFAFFVQQHVLRAVAANQEPLVPQENSVIAPAVLVRAFPLLDRTGFVWQMLDSIPIGVSDAIPLLIYFGSLGHALRAPFRDDLAVIDVVDINQEQPGQNAPPRLTLFPEQLAAGEAFWIGTRLTAARFPPSDKVLWPVQMPPLAGSEVLRLWKVGASGVAVEWFPKQDTYTLRVNEGTPSEQVITASGITASSTASDIVAFFDNGIFTRASPSIADPSTVPHRELAPGQRRGLTDAMQPQLIYRET